MKLLCLNLFLINAIANSFLCFFVCGFSDGLECNKNPYIKDAGPLVETKTGTVVGKYVKVFDTDIASFQGIPFAKPPLGDRRFAKAEPIEHWEGTLFVQEKPPACMQYSSRSSQEFVWLPSGLNSSEDCLYLNIWAPTKCYCSTFDKLPVLVWIHGGGYFSGSSSMEVYDGSVLASYGEVIVVSINYRVGLFGFLNGGTTEAPGNAGLYDQVVALQWIKANIQYFGGDPKNINIFGQSAGSISTSLHVISPLSRDLFHRAIMQSGTAYQPHFVDDFKVAIYKAKTFAEVIGCSNEETNFKNSPSDVIACLKKKDPSELAQTEDIFTSKFPYYFGPSFGTSCEGCNEFLPESPIKMLESGKISQVPILIGINKDEGAIFLRYLMPDIFATDRKTNLTLLQAKNVIRGLFSAAPEVPPELIFDFYFRNITEDGSDDIVEAISNAFGDFAFACPSMFFAEKAKEAYLYWMTHRSQKDSNDEWMGVIHSNEIPYVFGKPIINTRQYTPEDGSFSGDLIQKWGSFAHEGYPLNKDNKKEWPKFCSANPLAYVLNPRSDGSLPFPRLGACEFWRPYFVYQSS